jgi:tungstate transport system substrate-binding protein
MPHVRISWVVMFAAIVFVSLIGTCPALAENGLVRLALVVVPDELLRPLLPDFQKQTGIRADIVYSGNDPFAVAKAGKADLVISHYGHEGAKPFVTGGFGLWPHPVFANQMVLLGPPKDPAGVRRLTDASEAFRRIAATKSNFVTSSGAGSKYLEQILWQSASASEKGSWYIDPKSEGAQVVKEAARRGCLCALGTAPPTYG